MEKILKAQLKLCSNIENFYTNSTSKVKAESQTIHHFETRLSILDNYWKTFTSRHDDLIDYEDKIVDDDYFEKDVYTSIEMAYSEARSLILGKIAALKTNTPPHPMPQPTGNPTVEVQASLPPLQLPTFSGKQEEWESFKQRFSSLVKDKTNISNVAKLQHLMSALQGSAAQRLKGIEITDANFQVAWDKLIRRYDNVRIRLFNSIENLIQLPPVKARNVHELNEIMDRAEEAVRALKDLGCPIDQTNYFVVHCVIRKLDLNSRESWEISQEATDGFPTYIDLTRFIERRVHALEQAHTGTDTPSSRNKQSSTHMPQNQAKRVSVHTAQSEVSTDKLSGCLLCKGNHILGRCMKFKSMSLAQRLEYCKNEKLCLNCLKTSHFADKCPSPNRCFYCQGNHHSKLHFEKNTGKAQQSNQINWRSSANTDSNEKSASNSHEQGVVNVHSVRVGHAVLLATARICIKGPNGNLFSIRALIDPAAERSFIARHVVSELSLTCKQIDIKVVGVGAEESSRAREEVMLQLVSPKLENFRLSIFALVLPKLTRYLPSNKIIQSNWSHIKDLDLADPDFAEPHKIDCILGADAYSSIMLSGLIRGPKDTPVAQNSVFGWILTGPTLSQTCCCNTALVQAFHTYTDQSLSENLQRFWEIEEVPRRSLLTEDERYCDEHFAQTHTRSPDGRFIVRLPLRSNPDFVSTRDIAVACLLRSEKRLRNNLELSNSYCTFMQEYLDMHHMELVPPDKLDRPCFYLPHHAVIRPENPSKVRIVFNASQRDSKGRSLNDMLLPGPKLQADVLQVLTQWRFSKFVFTTDVVKMFRQILVHPDDADWQRVLWRPTTDQPIRDYRCITVTYGTSSAPYLALKVMQKLAEDNEESHPHAAEILKRKLYVDDFFAGADTVETARERRDQLIQVLASAGMTLAKWAANDNGLLQGLSSVSAKEVELKLDEVISTLGLKWLPSIDAFTFSVKDLGVNYEFTKRTILSEIARLFDPLGWLAPIMIIAKIILQDLWLNDLDWDSSVPDALSQRWVLFRNELKEVSLIRIPRWLGGKEREVWHLHGFADASKRAYAAVLYAVTPGQTASLLLAKTKLAPTKVQTLPRLELCGCALLVRLTKHLLSSSAIQPASIHCWTDSKVVLEWLKSHPSRWPTFVANRTSEILTELPSATWHHVRSADNPADGATRGFSPAVLAKLDLWWHGPSWLLQDESAWPSLTPSEPLTPAHLQVFAIQAQQHEKSKQVVSPECLPTLQKFSAFSKIIRILSYCYRWRTRAAQKCIERAKILMLGTEYRMGKVYCYRAIQAQHFPAEKMCLSAGEPLTKHSALRRLSPFLDEQGLIRVGGRLDHSLLPYNERHPIILPGGCQFVRRLVEETHLLTMHGGVQLMMSHLRRSLWVTRDQRVAAGVLHRCVICTRHAARSSEQQLGQLPAARITPARPFTHTGVDYAGPFPILFSRGRGAKSTKGYIAIFVCLVSRAMHVEVVSDLTSASFLAAYSRFCARRGVCAVLYSDNATNFRGAASELRRMFHSSSEFLVTVIDTIARQGTDWSFIPPRAPHMGGLWEAAVRSVKYHLIRVVGDSKLTFEELTTLCSKVEACLNSRPLCPLSSEASGDLALTPAHFLVGSALLSHPEPYDEGQQFSPQTDRWKLLTDMRNSFWANWRREVLHQHLRRNKWLKPQPNIVQGDVVLIKDELTPPTKWPLGLVTATHPGADGLVRVVTIKTAESSFVRPIAKVIKLLSEPELDKCVETHKI